MHALQYAARHGERLVRISGGPINVHLVNDPSLVSTVLGRGNERYRHSPDFRFWYPPAGEGLATSHHEKWMRQRRMLAPFFKSHYDSRLTEMLRRESNHLLSRLAAEPSRKSNEVEVQAEILQTTLRVAVGHLLLSPFPGNSAHVSASIQFLQRYTVPRRAVIFEGLNVLSKRLAQAYFNPAKKREALSVLTEQVELIIETATRHPHQRAPMLAALMEEDEKGLLDPEELRHEVATFLVAAVDTVTSSIAWALWHLAGDSDLQNRFRAGDKDFRDAVVAESIRLVPPIWIYWREVTETHELGGQTISPGDLVAFCPFVLHRNERYWERPDEFDESRFLDGTRSSGNSGYHYLPFGHGGHACIGKRMASIMTESVLRDIVDHFSLSRSSNVSTDLSKIVSTHVVVLARNGMRLRLTKR